MRRPCWTSCSSVDLLLDLAFRGWVLSCIRINNFIKSSSQCILFQLDDCGNKIGFNTLKQRFLTKWIMLRITGMADKSFSPCQVQRIYQTCLPPRKLSLSYTKWRQQCSKSVIFCLIIQSFVTKARKLFRNKDCAECFLKQNSPDKAISCKHGHWSRLIVFPGIWKEIAMGLPTLFQPPPQSKRNFKQGNDQPK